MVAGACMLAGVKPHLPCLSVAAALLTAAACRSVPVPGTPDSAAAPAPAPAAAPSLARAVEDSMRRVLARAMTDSAFPGAVAVVGRGSGVLATVAVGTTDWNGAVAVDDRTVWDLASLTKVLGMTSAMMQLVEQGRVALDAPVQRYLPEWTGPGKERVTIRHLLTHTSGLPAFRAYDRITTDADSMAKLMMAEPLDTVPGARMVYSDIGAWVAGKVVERVSGLPLDRYVVERVFAPLYMYDTRYRPPAEWKARIAPTEIDSLRGGKVHGAVHDERAYYLGGVSAHAGLFGTAHDLARFARMYLNRGTLDGTRIFQPATIDTFTTRQVADRALGWQKPTPRGSAGSRMSPRAFGHTGFTGTSFWVDPANDVFVILLSNRVNPTRNNPRIGRVRTALADAVMGAFGVTATSTASPE